jgi:hypothetical protein
MHLLGVAYWRHTAILSSASYAITCSHMQLHLLTGIVVTFKLHLKLLVFQMTNEKKLAPVVRHHLTHILVSRLA